MQIAIIIDGGTSSFRDSVRRANELEGGSRLIDTSTSGGLENGYALMVGGDPSAYEIVKPALETTNGLDRSAKKA